MTVFARVLVLVLWLLPLQAMAWGEDGHNIVCAIAWDEMPEGTQRAVEQVLGEHGREAFADSCNWADHVRGDRPHTARWHTIGIARGAAHIDLARDCPPQPGCVVSALENNLDALRRAPDALTRGEALRFIGHFVGDIHQPLHAAFQDNRWGSGVEGEIVGRKMNMHHVWDYALLEAWNEPWQTTAARLGASITDGDRAAWAGGAPLAWAQESYDAVRRPEVGYVAIQPGFQFGAQYVRDNQPTVELRLKMAAVRLADLLTQALAVR